MARLNRPIHRWDGFRARFSIVAFEGHAILACRALLEVGNGKIGADECDSAKRYVISGWRRPAVDSPNTEGWSDGAGIGWPKTRVTYITDMTGLSGAMVCV